VRHYPASVALQQLAALNFISTADWLQTLLLLCCCCCSDLVVVYEAPGFAHCCLKHRLKRCSNHISYCSRTLPLLLLLLLQ
jgi:hypothetical protein